jgi:hypothetical protein
MAEEKVDDLLYKLKEFSVRMCESTRSPPLVPPLVFKNDAKFV